MQKIRHFHLVRIWFALDIVIALAPPLYWAADAYKTSSILQVPVPLVYFLTVSLSIAASILYAYWAETASGDYTS